MKSVMNDWTGSHENNFSQYKSVLDQLYAYLCYNLGPES